MKEAAVGEETVIREMRESLVVFRETAQRVVRRVRESQTTLRAVLTPPGGVPIAQHEDDSPPLAVPPRER